MTTELPDAAKVWFDAGEYVTVATLLADGQPQLSVLWAARDGNDVLLSTLQGRQKHKNLLADSRITVLCFPKDNPFSYIEIRGQASMTREGGRELIEALSQKYTANSYPEEPAGDVRVVIRVHADKVVFRG
jgi:PPOX class probable F420-dependent enzyme